MERNRIVSLTKHLLSDPEHDNNISCNGYSKESQYSLNNKKKGLVITLI